MSWSDVILATAIKVLMCLGVIYLTDRYADGNAAVMLAGVLVALVLFEVHNWRRPR